MAGWKSRALTALLLALLLALGCSSRGQTTSILAGRAPAAHANVDEPVRLTDGTRASWGGFWQTRATSLFSGTQAFVAYDLGGQTRISSLYLVGDDNDRYAFSVSDDGKSYRQVWIADRVGRGGQRARFKGDLALTARWLRVAPLDGDNHFSISELAAYSEPLAAAPEFDSISVLPKAEEVRTASLYFAAFLLAFIVLCSSRLPALVRWSTVILPVVGIVLLVRALAANWPVAPREVSLLRALAAGVAGFAVFWRAFGPRRFAPDRRGQIGVLALCGALASAAFLNLGHPQFWDAKTNQPSAVHNFDMRVYYPVAKYFHELGYDGLYLASVAAYVDDDPNVTLDSLANVTLRDLRTHHVQRVSEVRGEIEATRYRFSPERWQEFKADMRYFRETMGPPAYLSSMNDHGANATPVWFLFTHALFVKTHASNSVLLAAALLDPLLLAFMFVMIWRTFGPKTMLVALIVFGANDFYMFGSNWAGATLRHDWMAYLGLGACALKRERWLLGGALLTLSGLIRAFPLLSLLGVALPSLYWLFATWAGERKLPRWSRIWREQRALFRTGLGAVATAGSLVAVSSLVFSGQSWVSWFKKVRLLDAGAHVNHVSLRTLLVGTGGDFRQILDARMALMLGVGVAAGLLALLASRNSNRGRAAILGMLLLPIVFHPANYYMHSVFLFALLAEEVRGELSGWDAVTWLSLLGLCAFQYLSVLAPNLDLHFYFASVLLFAAFAVLLPNEVRRAFARKFVAVAAEPVPAEAPELVVGANPPLVGSSRPA